MAEARFHYTFRHSFLPTFLLVQVRDAEACALFFFLAGSMETCRDNVIGLSSRWRLTTNECTSSRCSSQILTWKLFIKLLHLRVVLKAEGRGSVGCRSLTCRPSCRTFDQNGDSVLLFLSTTAFFDLCSHIQFLPKLKKQFSFHIDVHFFVLSHK